MKKMTVPLPLNPLRRALRRLPQPRASRLLPAAAALRLLPAAMALALLAGACSQGPAQGRCDVEVYSPSRQYSDARLLDSKGAVIDSTLTVRNDSIRFSRADSAGMPYVATLRLMNPSDSLDIIAMPIVIEGGTVRLDLADRISLSGTPGNDALFKFLKAKNSFSARYAREGNPGHDIAKMRRDYSEFYAKQILLHKGSVVGDYLWSAYSGALTAEDYSRVREKLGK